MFTKNLRNAYKYGIADPQAMIYNFCDDEVIMQKYVRGKEKFSYGFAAVGSFMIANVIASYLSYFLTDILLVSTTFVSVLMIVARIWDMLNDPLMGVLIDRTKTPQGKMRPYIKVGAFLIFFVSVFMFLPLSDADPIFRMAFAAVMYLAFDTAYTVVDVPFMGLISVATPDDKERSSLLTFYVTLGSFGTVATILLLPVFQSFLPEKWVYFALSATVGVVAFSGYMMLYRKSKERYATVSEKISVKDMFSTAAKNKPMILTLLTSMIASPRYLLMLSAAYISTYVIKIPGLSSGTVLVILYLVVGSGMFGGILLTPIVYKKAGFKRTTLIFGSIGGICLAAAFFIGKINYYAALPFMTLGGLGLGAYNTLPYPMVGDSLNYLEWKTGKRMEGVCFSWNSFVTKFNNAVAAIMLSVGLIVFKFVQPVNPGDPLPQSDFTITGLYALVTLIPAISFFISLAPAALNSYTGKRRAFIMEELRQRKAAVTDAVSVPVAVKVGTDASVPNAADNVYAGLAADNAAQATEIKR